MEKELLDKWLTQVAAGNDAAFERLYESMKRGVFAFAYAYLGNRADAEDAVQDTFLQVKRKIALYKRGTDARAWIFQIAKNLALDELRKRKTRQKAQTEKTEIAVEPAFPLLDEITAALSNEEKEIVILHAVWGYKHREIAQMKGLPLGTVTWKYNAAIEKLRKQRKEDDE
ncbi:MAG: RNA polymerase sigma factor [Clostridia bacterium]|nr:RNA polymerase sigma factor [Clostridia bacterium]